MSSTPDTTTPAATARPRHAALRYSLLRLAVFAACFVVVAILASAGVVPESLGAANPLWLVLVALVVSAPISFIVLRGQRDAMSQQVAPHVERAMTRLNANRSMEDGD
ncbi:DUF4229 domain-containing protein [Streptomyces sp. RFCAC02]|uniref:DUF4229 domain-containing protein n=1 Tax=Streptomyces sp. RFCAC02 TaxID=2499143 RepID=UPI00102293AD|nr:DUF4229 domain-containing protein [Streptomyces sp. RFCAC02]